MDAITASKMAETTTQSCFSSIFCQLHDKEGNVLGPITRFKAEAGYRDLQIIYENISNVPYPSDKIQFFINDHCILNNKKICDMLSELSTEEVISIRVEPLGLGEPTSPICRCTSTLSGHKECIVVARFNYQSTMLATGGGDGDVRLWDLTCDTPIRTLSGQGGWITDIAWCPDGTKLISGCRQGFVCLWKVSNGACAKLTKHQPHWISCVVFDPSGVEFASGSKDRTVRIWAKRANRLTLGGHTDSVIEIVWPRTDILISASHDRTVKIWETIDGKQVQNIIHSHWVNCLSYNIRNQSILLATASDDFIVRLCDISKSNEIKKLIGHCQPVINVKFSPDGELIASCAFDKSVKLWSRAGDFICNFLGHVGRVYQISWSPDSRYLVSASADSTVKLWSIRSRKLRVDLPGHADEVYTLDWSRDGQVIATGGKDRNLKLWRR